MSSQNRGSYESVIKDHMAYDRISNTFIITFNMG